jgi:hypothetical protein
LDLIPFLRQRQRGTHNGSRGCALIPEPADKFSTNSKNIELEFLGWRTIFPMVKRLAFHLFMIEGKMRDSVNLITGSGSREKKGVSIWSKSKI